jgi:hypothetical protein
MKCQWLLLLNAFNIINVLRLFGRKPAGAATGSRQFPLETSEVSGSDYFPCHTASIED